MASAKALRILASQSNGSDARYFSPFGGSSTYDAFQNAVSRRNETNCQYQEVNHFDVSKQKLNAYCDELPTMNIKNALFLVPIIYFRK